MIKIENDYKKFYCKQFNFYCLLFNYWLIKLSNTMKYD